MAVVLVNSSMLARVPGPAEREAMDATISPYATGATRDTAATIGMVACPPQVTMFTLAAATCSSRLTEGTTYGPSAAGVRSTTSLSYPLSTLAWCWWAPAEVASKTTRASANPGISSSPSTPRAVVATFIRPARASPSDAGSMPTMAATCSAGDNRLILIIRSVPMLPDPMITAPTVIRRPPPPRKARPAGRGTGPAR